MTLKKSFLENAPDIIPAKIGKKTGIADLIELYGKISFEARKVHRGSLLLQRMIDDGDVIWLGIAGAGIAGGMGGMVISLLEAGFIDVICSTGAQVYHDLHFAFGLPVKAISPVVDDDALRKCGDTRIYDIGIREKETLEVQDEIIRTFVQARHKELSRRPIASWEFNHEMGLWAARNAPHPDRSFVITAARLGVPVFWDSQANHSIAMNLALTDRLGFPVQLSAQRDIFDAAAITYASGRTGFIELGGGGPKNFIQQTGPTIHQIFNVPFDGADRGLQIGTAPEREGSLSGCTFSEAVTWGKYRRTSEEKLVQIWGDYSVIFPLLATYAMSQCARRRRKKIVSQLPVFIQKLESAHASQSQTIPVS
jgi:deoxyhypusine synthase